MPYKEPRKVKGGFTLPKVGGGIHRSSGGKRVVFRSASAARRAASYILALEHGFKPNKNKRAKGKK